MSRSSGRTPVLSARAKEASSARQARGEAGRKKSSQGFAELVQQREREVEACGGEESAGEEDLVELVEIRTSGTYGSYGVVGGAMSSRVAPNRTQDAV